MEGYRGWNLTEDGLLRSNFSAKDTPYLWDKNPMRASCNHGCEIDLCIREHDCNCGIYSLADIAAVKKTYPSFDVYGAITVHGAVHIGERGYRSEFATIRALFVGDFATKARLEKIYHDVTVMVEPRLYVARQDSYTQQWDKRNQRAKAQAQRLDLARNSYPGGLEAEKTAIAEKLRNATLSEIVSFAKTQADDPEWTMRIWAGKPENSRKARPGDIVFEANNTSTPYVFIGSTRAFNNSLSIRWLISHGGLLMRRVNIRRWDEEPTMLEERKQAIAEWK